MELADLILKSGQVILTETQNDSEIQPENSPALFGEVVAINQLTNSYELGDRVLFNADSSFRFTISGYTYYLTTENNIKLKYTYIAP